MQAVSGGGRTGPERAVRSDRGAGLSAIAAFFGKEGAVGIFSAVDALDLTMTQVRVLHGGSRIRGDVDGGSQPGGGQLGAPRVPRAT